MWLTWVVILLVAVIVLSFMQGCAANGRTLSPEDVAAVVAGVANVQQNETEAGRDVITQTFDQWGPRIDAITRLVDALKKWWIWIVVGISAIAYVPGKVAWLAARWAKGYVLRKVNGKAASGGTVAR